MFDGVPMDSPVRRIPIVERAYLWQMPGTSWYLMPYNG
jgi:hypothetical protein